MDISGPEFEKYGRIRQKVRYGAVMIPTDEEVNVSMRGAIVHIYNIVNASMR